MIHEGEIKKRLHVSSEMPSRLMNKPFSGISHAFGML